MKREAQGFWWSPDRPDERVFGILQHSNGGSPNLELFSGGTSASKAVEFGSVIHGTDERGTPITLLNASQGNSSRGWSVWGNGLERRQIHAGTALIGIHAAETESVGFNTIRIELQQLDGWLGISGFSKDSFLGFPESRLHYRVPEAETFLVEGDIEVRWRVFPQLNDQFVDGRNCRRISDLAAVELCSQNGISLKEYAYFLKALRLLLHFASLRPVYPVSVVGWQDDHAFQVGDESIKQEIQVWTSLIHGPESEMPFPDLWTFRYECIRGRFSEIFEKLLRAADELGEAINCYSTTVYHRLPTAVECLCLVQALEAFDGVCNGTFKKRNLNAKIERLVTLHSSALNDLIADAATFGGQVQEARHYYTHHNPEDLNRGMVSKGVDLIRMNERLKILFQTCMLSRLGIPEPNFGRLRRQIASRIVEYEY